MIMSKHTRVSRPIYHLLHTKVEGVDSLTEPALDLHWSWNHATDEVRRQLYPELWEITHNPYLTDLGPVDMPFSDRESYATHSWPTPVELAGGRK